MQTKPFVCKPEEKYETAGYRGSYATFGSEENLHKPKMALGKIFS